MSVHLRRRWVAAIVGLQLAVPTVALLMAPSQFGFQMYSGADWTKVEMEDARGEVHKLHLSSYTAKGRGDIDWTERLPERICEMEPEAVRVTVERWRTQRSVTCP